MKLIKCKNCGRLKKHKGKGLCLNCYAKLWRAENRAHYRKWWREYEKKEKRKMRRKTKSFKEYHRQYEELHHIKEKSRYGMPRKEILKRANYQCQICKKRKNLIIHHKDGRGTTVLAKERNNRPENLIVLCQPCHLKIYHPEKKRLKKPALFNGLSTRK